VPGHVQGKSSSKQQGLAKPVLPQPEEPGDSVGKGGALGTLAMQKKSSPHSKISKFKTFVQPAPRLSASLFCASFTVLNTFPLHTHILHHG